MKNKKFNIAENTHPEKPTTVFPEIQFKESYCNVPPSSLINETLEKLAQTCYWARNKKVPEKNIVESLFTILNEFSMKYGYTEIPDFSLGDIAEVNFGYHIPGEINGNHVHSIICNIAGDSVFVVPIIKDIKFLGYSTSYMPLDISNDIEYYEKFIYNGVALLDKGRSIRTKRLVSVVGKAKPEFFSKVLETLATSTFDFRKNIIS